MVNILKAILNGLLIILGAKFFERLLGNNKKDKHCIDPDITADRSNAKYIPNQMIVWKKDGVNDAEFARWKKDHLQKYPGLLANKLCANCDDSLELWEGDNVSTFISEKVAGSSGSPAGGGVTGGGDAVACFTYNLIIDLPQPAACIPRWNDKDFRIAQRSVTNDKPIIVAVFDTGLMPVMKATYSGVVQSCMPSGNNGWNFAYKSDVTNDDYPSVHGSTVTQFIIDQETKYQKRRIMILPVKVHNSSGKSDLFSVLCGFAYAAKCGAKIVNASFGFYSAKNTQAPTILTQFLKKHLTDNNILLIAAAGNVNADECIGRENEEAVRNLDLHPFFPACLSKDFENVIVVTTVSGDEGKVSPSQNFSTAIVDIGVNCDQVTEGDYRFQDPLGRDLFIVGSSYATPIITGKIAQHYDELTQGMASGINKSSLLAKMLELNLIEEDARFDRHIKNGNCATK